MMTRDSCSWIEESGDAPPPPPPNTQTTTETQTNKQTAVCLFIGCLTSQQQSSVSLGRICSDKLTCCHTETEVADQLSISPSHNIMIVRLTDRQTAAARTTATTTTEKQTRPTNLPTNQWTDRPTQLLVFNAQPTGTVISRRYTLQSLLIFKNFGLLKGYCF